MRPFIATAVFTALAGGAWAAQAADYARVVSSTPVTSATPVSRQVCDEARQFVREPSSGAGAVIGAIAGGVIANTLGHGAGRAVATGIGAVTGAMVGDNVETGGRRVAEVPVERCRTVSRWEDRVVGYDVTYDYAGRHYTTRMAHDPGSQIAVDVQPVDPGVSRSTAPVYETPRRAVPPRSDYYERYERAPVQTYESAPSTVYYEPLPRSSTYYAPVPPAAYIAPVIGFGLGYYIGNGGHRGGHGHYRGHGRYRGH